MKQTPLTPYMERAGIRSARELSELIGVKERTFNRLIDSPGDLRAWQINKICEFCGISWAEFGSIVERGPTWRRSIH